MIAKTVADVKLLFPEIDTDHLADAILSREGEMAPGFPIADAASPQKHRTKVPDYAFPLSAIVARPVGKKEIDKTPAAKKALDIEWDKLVKAGVWDEKHPREWSALSLSLIHI